MDKGKVHTTICHRRTKKPKFDFSMVVAGFLVSTTLLSTTLTTPAYAREVYKIPTSTSSVTSTTNILDTSAYELSQFKALVKQGIIDVAMLESVYHSLNDVLNDVDDGKVDTYSAEFISYVADATVCFDKIDVSNMSIINDMGMRDTYLDESRRFLGALGESISFVDVKADDWFYKNVQSTTAHGLINGIGDSKFNPQGTLTIAEAIKLVASANAYYNNDLDSLSVSTSGHWVSNYLTYAQQKGIVTTSYSDLDSAITRGQMAELFARALPASEYAQINDFNNARERNVSDAVKTLYTSGIMIGDDTGSFRVNDTITRAETAAIINRVIIPDARVKTSEGVVTTPTQRLEKYDTRVYEVFNLVNEARKEAGVEPLVLDDDLCLAASIRAEEISILYSHTRPDGTAYAFTLSSMVIKKYPGGENIAKGYRSSEDVMRGWMNSPGHRENILAKRYKEIGIGFYESAGREFWVQSFN